MSGFASSKGVFACIGVAILFGCSGTPLSPEEGKALPNTFYELGTLKSDAEALANDVFRTSAQCKDNYETAKRRSKDYVDAIYNSVKLLGGTSGLESAGNDFANKYAAFEACAQGPKGNEDPGEIATFIIGIGVEGYKQWKAAKVDERRAALASLRESLDGYVWADWPKDTSQ